MKSNERALGPTAEAAQPRVDAPAARRCLLGVEHLTKKYGSVTVLDDVNVDFRAAEVHALLGENGAGKSTLVKIIAGVFPADAGEVVGQAHDAGDIAMVFQELSVIPEMSVFDNLVLASRHFGLLVPYRRLRPQAIRSLESAGLGGLDLETPVATLSLARRQLLEIARGLMVDAKVLILDEPTATLSDVEIERVHGVIRRLKAAGHCIVYITHRLGEVFALSDRITIMRAGRVVASGATSQFQMADVVRHMLGEDHAVQSVHELPNPARHGVAGTLSCRDLSALGRFRGVSFDVPAGVVLAFFGQVGSGADELVRSLAGLAPPRRGSVTLHGKELPLRSRAQSQADGIAYVSADRVSEGVFLNASVVTNMSSGALKRVSRFGFIKRKAERDLARSVAESVSLDQRRVREQVIAFSGGNQQKVAIGRALATRPKVLVLNEPTRGVDIGARAEIYRSIRTLLEDDVVVVVYTSDIVEIRELADRTITMYRGDVIGDHWVREVDDATLIGEILNGAEA